MVEPEGLKQINPRGRTRALLYFQIGDNDNHRRMGLAPCWKLPTARTIRMGQAPSYDEFPEQWPMVFQATQKR